MWKVSASIGFGVYETLSVHETLEAAWYARNAVTTKRTYPCLNWDSQGRQLCIVEVPA